MKGSDSDPRICIYFLIFRKHSRILLYTTRYDFFSLKMISLSHPYWFFHGVASTTRTAHPHGSVPVLVFLTPEVLPRCPHHHTRRINNYNRSHWKQLHGLAYRIRGSLNIGKLSSKFLTCHFIYNSHFPAFPSAKN